MNSIISSQPGTLVLLDLTHHKAMPEAFQNADEKTLLVTDNEIFGEQEDKQRQSQQKISLEFLASLQPDDFVIHIDHGIGRFLGIVTRSVDDVTREYLELEYGGGDRLFVPVDQADRVSKFLGIKDGSTPTLTRLGSAEWASVKKRVHKETQQIARDLLLLYAKRAEVKGFSAIKESKWQEEFDNAFPYEETSGQIKAIREIYSDMAKPRPMDRLVCGDVGFGKTEVAMRAAFRAVMNGRQVAVLTPITILADQHYKSFRKRMDGFPVRIAALTRFQKPAEQKEIIDKLGAGEIDIVVGTHRLLSNDVKFKNLGLLIVDEEQRFGVKQKERLKKKRLEMDVLTMTATPIPRTLNMSLNGIRDISTITTPPPGRLPIITEVRKFSHTLIREAILRELDRQGQVYILHNRVETIDIFAEKIRQLVPEAKAIVAHGQLKAEDLEQRIHDFVDGKFDILVSSTIIENGIDLARANTLIVDRAEAFGLAQLYQLRGRIGRGRHQAYAYFLYHSQRLQPDAKARLKAVMEATELGAGFQIAMRDLEIRGAGNILGTEQSGTVDTVGVAHFTRLLNQAVEDMKVGKFGDSDEPIEITLDLPVSGYIPNHFIDDIQQKIIIYQKLSSADNLESLNEVVNEIEKKYGSLPKEIKNLHRILELKILARQVGIINIRQENGGSDKQNAKAQIVMVMSGAVKPKEIVQLLDFNAKWQISSDKLKIRREDLGDAWFSNLIECVRRMGVK
ncbi:MAG: transcription-repair coupling factor [Patescibacteria group bacterium]|nr:transcription-repair coupling factor [Patescibacteria group bacterium]